MAGSALQVGPAPTYGDAQTCIHCRHCQRHERPVPHPHGGAPSKELLNLDCTLMHRWIGRSGLAPSWCPVAR